MMNVALKTKDIDVALYMSLSDADVLNPSRDKVLLELAALPEKALKDAVTTLVQVDDDEDRAAFVQRALLIKQAIECEKPLKRRLI